VGDAHLVLDPVGGEAEGTRCALRAGGLLITVPGGGDLPGLRKDARGPVRVTDILVEPDRAGLEALAALVDNGELRPHVAATFPFEHPPAHTNLGETRRTQEKLVLIP
jgi:NADPH:quinone reductase-like Zn-dependent oxidoreductase